MTCLDLVVIIEGSELAFKSCANLRCIHPLSTTVDMTLDAPKKNERHCFVSFLGLAQKANFATDSATSYPGK